MNPDDRPYASRMMPYSPAARGNIANNSAYVSAPASESNPATSHTVKALPGVPTLQVITRALRNTPVPMTFATLTEIAATKPRPRINWPLVSFEFGVSSFAFISQEVSADYTDYADSEKELATKTHKGSKEN